MPQGPDGKTIIIVKKVSGHGGHHGGAWKVAYADFVTAMMALFMVLWLVNTASVTTREKIASYFRRPGVFENGSGTPLELGGGGILSDTFAPPAEGNSQTAPHHQVYLIDSDGGLKKEGFSGGLGKGKDPAMGEWDKESKEPPKSSSHKGDIDRIASELEQEITKNQKSIAGAIGQMSIKVDQRGLHLEIMDTPTASMFEKGRDSILPAADAELKRITAILAKLPNPLDIEGHTDATPFRAATGKSYDNWNLSVDRANAARRSLLLAGLPQAKIARVVGYADQRPKIKEDPFAAANRRISVSMRYTDEAAAALVGTDFSETKAGKLEKTSKPSKAPVIPVPETAAAPEISSAAGLGGSSAVSLPVTPSIEAEEEAPKEQPVAPEDTTISRSSSNGLKFEVETSMPEGAIIDQSEEPSSNSKLEDDKIFGDEHPFFGK